MRVSIKYKYSYTGDFCGNVECVRGDAISSLYTYK
jgi:hypothetical protein